jgi:hypothetical protein
MRSKQQRKSRQQPKRKPKRYANNTTQVESLQSQLSFAVFWRKPTPMLARILADSKALRAWSKLNQALPQMKITASLASVRETPRVSNRAIFTSPLTSRLTQRERPPISPPCNLHTQRHKVVHGELKKKEMI